MSLSSSAEHELSRYDRVARVDFVSSSEEGEELHIRLHPDHLEGDDHTVAVAEEVDHNPVEDHHTPVAGEADRNLAADHHILAAVPRSLVEVDLHILAEGHRSPAVVVEHCSSRLWHHRRSRYYRAKA